MVVGLVQRTAPMRTGAFRTALALFLLLPLFVAGAQLTGKVVRIVDGDTLVILDPATTQIWTRVVGIDVYE